MNWDLFIYRYNDREGEQDTLIAQYRRVRIVYEPERERVAYAYTGDDILAKLLVWDDYPVEVAAEKIVVNGTLDPPFVLGSETYGYWELTAPRRILDEQIELALRAAIGNHCRNSDFVFCSSCTGARQLLEQSLKADAGQESITAAIDRRGRLAERATIAKMMDSIARRLMQSMPPELVGSLNCTQYANAIRAGLFSVAPEEPLSVSQQVFALGEVYRTRESRSELIAAQCLMTLASALAQGGEPLEAFGDFCTRFAENTIERIEGSEA